MRLLYALALAALLAVPLSACGPSAAAIAKREAAEQRLTDAEQARAERQARDQANADAARARVEANRVAAVRQRVVADSTRSANEAAARAETARPVRYAHGAVNVRSGPGTSNARVAQLDRDDTVFLEACEGGWCRVAPAFGDGTWREGYVSEPLLHAEAAPPARVSAPTPARSTTRRTAPATRRARTVSRTYFTGPRGGCYYINGNGNRTYVEHSYCGR